MAALQSASDAHGQHLPPVSINEDRYQIRDLVRVGMVWGGSFAKLRSDAPHIVDSQNTERQIELDAGDQCFQGDPNRPKAECSTDPNSTAR